MTSRPHCGDPPVAPEVRAGQSPAQRLSSARLAAEHLRSSPSRAGDALPLLRRARLQWLEPELHRVPQRRTHRPLGQPPTPRRRADPYQGQRLIPLAGSRRRRTLGASTSWLFAPSTDIVPLFACLRRMGVPPALLHVLSPLGNLFEGSVTSEPVVNQPVADHGPGATDPAPAVDIDRSATLQSVVDGVEGCCHLPGAAWHGHVDDRMMLPLDRDAFRVRLFLRNSHMRLVPRGSWLAWRRRSAGCSPAGDQGSADGEFAHS